MNSANGDKGNPAAPVLSRAEAYVAAGLSVIPVRADGSKQPAVPWGDYQERRPTRAELRGWFAAGKHGIAVVGGQVSGGLEVIDFEDTAVFSRWRERVDAEAPGLLARLPVVQTPRPGRHVYYRCARAEGSKKLARIAAGQTLVERKGEGGYVLAPGSPAACHPTGGTYELLSGPPLTAIPQIAPDARRRSLAPWLCCWPTSSPTPGRSRLEAAPRSVGLRDRSPRRKRQKRHKDYALPGLTALSALLARSWGSS